MLHVVLTALFALATVSHALVKPLQSAACPDICSSATAPFFRAFDAADIDHFYTHSLPGITSAAPAYARQPDAGRVLAANQTGAVPLFQLFNPSQVDHFYTVDPDERASLADGAGWLDQGVAAFILSNPQCGAIPFYRTFNAAGSDHFYTTDTAEMANAITKHGYVFEETVGFIFPATG